MDLRSGVHDRPGFTALFRVSGWDAGRDWEYRVEYAPGTAVGGTYSGRIARDPVAAASVAVAVVNCSIRSYRPLDAASRLRGPLPAERGLGLYTSDNLYFPYADVVTGIRQAGADLLAVLGDPFYEHRPTDTDPSAGPVLDDLYRWYLWLWAFRDLTRDTPATSVPRPGSTSSSGFSAVTTRMPPTRHRYSRGSASTTGRCGSAASASPGWRTGSSRPAIRTTSIPGGRRNPLPSLELLGRRQEAFLADWGASNPGRPKVCLTQTLWGCLKTLPTARFTGTPTPAAIPSPAGPAPCGW